MSPSTLVQGALRAALAGLAPAYDAVPPDAVAPYLTVGPDIVSDWSTKTSEGREHRVSVGVWDDAPGLARVHAMLGAVAVAVRPLAASGSGWRIANVLFLRSFIVRDPEHWHHGIAEFRIRTEEI